jgi:hypothetical protein
MFNRANEENIAFNNYFEWVSNDISKCLYSFDDFIEKDAKNR